MTPSVGGLAINRWLGGARPSDGNHGLARVRSAGSEEAPAVELVGQDRLDPFLLEGTVDVLDDFVEGGQPFVVEAGVERGADQIEGELDMFEEAGGVLSCDRVVVEPGDELGAVGAILLKCFLEGGVEVSAKY